ncbi:uncharacterized protein LOC132560337 [Ylistrum balloti]|uniref:uncharacterized protein LOC132560337 n=1 Tax=Ylistrum balloti TaxID=509963 RepID=UPI002905A262|nr:uncharacterized protein LOC132560337 [Ylistrum balloti]
MNPLRRMVEQCAHCGAQNASLRRCTGCMKVYYCSKECQKRDWKTLHKKSCKRDAKQHEKSSEDGANESTTSVAPNKVCVVCSKTGNDVKTCSRCKQTNYCSRSCQRQDWPKHKQACKVVAPFPPTLPPNIDNIFRMMSPGATGFSPMMGFANPFFVGVDEPDQLNYRATPVPGFLDKAKVIARFHFPFCRILDDINDIPQEFLGMRPSGTNRVFVAFISRFHHYRMRHCIYVEDKDGVEIYVAFYLDFDNPFPYFHWTSVVPGRFICIEDPYIHFFLDGSVGIRVEEAESVRILPL